MSDFELKNTIQKILTYMEKEESLPEEIQHKYCSSIPNTSSAFERLEGVRLQNDLHLRNNDPVTAIELLDKTLSELKDLPEAHKEWRKLIHSIKDGLCGHAIISDESELLVRIYEKLIEVGSVDFRAHAPMVRHYLNLGRRDQAAEILEQLIVCANNYPQLREAIELFGSSSRNLSPGPNRPSPQTSESKTPELPPDEMEFILSTQQQMDIFWHQTRFQDMFKEASKVIEKYGVLNDITAPFYHSAAIALDFAEKWLEALPIFTELYHQYPHYLPFQNSFRVFCNRYQSFICRHLHTYSREALKRQEEIFSQFYFSPFDMLYQLALLDIKAGETNSEAIKKLKARFVLNPNNPDYLFKEYELSAHLGDKTALTKIKRRIESIYEKRPYDLRYSRLFSLLKDGEGL